MNFEYFPAPLERTGNTTKHVIYNTPLICVKRIVRWCACGVENQYWANGRVGDFNGGIGTHEATGAARNGTILHSDHGSQYTSEAYRHCLQRNGLKIRKWDESDPAPTVHLQKACVGCSKEN